MTDHKNNPGKPTRTIRTPNGVLAVQWADGRIRLNKVRLGAGRVLHQWPTKIDVRPLLLPPETPVEAVKQLNGWLREVAQKGGSPAARGEYFSAKGPVQAAEAYFANYDVLAPDKSRVWTYRASVARAYRPDFAVQREPDGTIRANILICPWLHRLRAAAVRLDVIAVQLTRSGEAA